MSLQHSSDGEGALVHPTTTAADSRGCVSTEQGRNPRLVWFGKGLEAHPRPTPCGAVLDRVCAHGLRPAPTWKEDTFAVSECSHSARGSPLVPPPLPPLLLLFFPLEEALFISEACINTGSIRQPQCVSLLCASLILTIRPPADSSRMEPDPLSEFAMNKHERDK